MIRWLGVVEKGAASSILSVDQSVEAGIRHHSWPLDGLGTPPWKGFHYRNQDMLFKRTNLLDCRQLLAIAC